MKLSLLVKIIAVLCVLALLLVGYGIFFERTFIEITNVRITSSKFKPASKLTLVQLSDLHISHWTAFEQRILQSVNSIQPDVIVITGDVFKSKELFERPESEAFQASLSAIVKFLSSLKAPLGVYVCRGNNDLGDDKEVSNIFLDSVQPLGVRVLSNQSVKLPGTDIYLLGVDFPQFDGEDAADFVVNSTENGKCLQSDVSIKNSYSHLLRRDNTSWRNYTYSGTFRSSAPDSSGVGVTFYSQFDRGYDRFYRLRKRAGYSTFVLSPHGAPQPRGQTEFDLEMLPHVWYRFKVDCQNTAAGTRLRAKVWQDGQPEPDWQADALDTSAAFDSGTIGVWSHGRGIQQFTDLSVVDSAGDTLWRANFADTPDSQNPLGWVDFNYESQAIPWLMQGIPDSAFSILLAHTPDMVLTAEAAQVDLQLSGHTHGGQVRIPGWGPPLVQTKLGRAFTQGLFQFGDTQLYVNRGLGTVMLPLRLFCRPEIAVFRLEGE